MKIKTYPSELGFWKGVIIKGVEVPYIVSNNGGIRNAKTLKLLTPTLDKYGYQHVCLFYNGKGHNWPVHRIVANAYLSNPENKPQINHIDGDKTHNYVNNLEWATAKENVIHSYKTGLHDNVAIGENHGNNVYSSKSIHLVCQLLENNKLTYAEISKESGVPIPTIHDILSKKYWTHISKKYNIDKYNVRKRKPVDEKTKNRIIRYAKKGKSVHDIRLLLGWKYSDQGNAVISYYVKKYQSFI